MNERVDETVSQFTIAMPDAYMKKGYVLPAIAMSQIQLLHEIEW